MEEFLASGTLLSLLFAVGCVAGLVDAIAGGGGLIALPVLLATGIGPVEALATNKLQGSFGTFSSSLYFFRNRLFRPAGTGLLVASAFAGSALGTLLVQHVDSAFLARGIPLLLIATALYVWFGPRLGDAPREARISRTGFAGSAVFGIGFYDGFFGPGTGSFLAIAFVLLLGFDLVQATAHTKLLNFTTNLASLLLFAAGGHIAWDLGLSMAAGQLMGAHLGARMVVRKGARLIRPAIVVTSLLISLKLLFDA